MKTSTTYLDIPFIMVDFAIVQFITTEENQNLELFEVKGYYNFSDPCPFLRGCG